MAIVYVETTIPSYLTARPSRDLIVAAHQQVTQDWWDVRRPLFDLVISQFVLDEASGGDSGAAERRLAVLYDLPVLEIVEEVGVLADAILLAHALPENAALDAAHIAVAAVHEVDFFLTWNCRHIANAESIPLVRRICQEHGFQCPAICTPEELMGG